MTDNHGYETPEKGATEWHESLNRNFRYIDRDIEIRDINAAKTDYRPKSGAKFLATDTEDVYVGDGSQWLRLATSGENPSFDTVSAKTLVDRESGNSYSVDQLSGGSGSGSVEPPVDAVVTLEGGTPSAYRADGTQISQDSDAGALLNTVMTHVASNGGGTVHIASGTYLSSTKIEVPSNLTIRGAGRGNTVFKCVSNETGWTSKSVPTRNVTIRDLTVDGNLQGNRTGINFNQSIDSLIQNVEVIDAGGTPEHPGTSPALRVTRGLRSNIVNCHVEGSNSVSIEAAITAENCFIVNCTVTRGRREGNAGFLHGISIEKSTSCGIIGCNIDSRNETRFNSFQPALNANNADNAVVANNTVRGTAGGLFNVNGDCYNNTYVGNTFEDGGEIKIGKGNAGWPHGTVIANNVFRGGGAEIGGENTLYANNLCSNHKVGIRSPTTPPSFVGNMWRDWEAGRDGAVLRIEQADNPGPLLIANNFFENERYDINGRDTIQISHDTGVIVGNSFGMGGTNGYAGPTLNFDDGVQEYLIANNRIRGTAGSEAVQGFSGLMVNNVIEDGGVTPNLTGTTIIKDNYTLGGSQTINSAAATYTIGGPRQGTYTGDGTTGRLLPTFTRPEHVIVEGSDGTKYDVHAQFGKGFEFNAPTGELSLSEAGFTVGGSSADADPNTSGETYTFYTR